MRKFLVSVNISDKNKLLSTKSVRITLEWTEKANEKTFETKIGEKLKDGYKISKILGWSLIEEEFTF